MKWLALALALALCPGCDGDPRDLGSTAKDAASRKDGAAKPPRKDGGGKSPDLARDSAPRDGTPSDSAPPPPPPKKPKQLNPCKVGKCWSASALSSLCGSSSLDEDYSSGKYNVHRYTLAPQPKVKVELTLAVTAGGYKPALVIQNPAGVTVADGERSSSSADLSVQVLATGKTSGPAKVRLTANKAMTLTIYATGWSVIQGGFSPMLSKSGKYRLTVASGCTPPKPGKLLSPPNFDSKNVKKGYYLLPQSQPPGLYTRKADDCSRGTKLLIDVLYTVAYHWKQKQPSLSPIKYLDLNEGTCSSVNHATHDDGTHADLTAGCATQVSCTNNQPAIDLAKLFVDTGQVCGIINNDTAVQKVVNAYFKSKFSYKPWHGTFMRSVSGHTHHFHVRVKKPNGSCN